MKLGENKYNYPKRKPWKYNAILTKWDITYIEPEVYVFNYSLQGCVVWTFGEKWSREWGRQSEKIYKRIILLLNWKTKKKIYIPYKIGLSGVNMKELWEQLEEKQTFCFTPYVCAGFGADRSL